MGQEYCGIVEEVGSDVTSVKPGHFVIGSFFASDNTCPNCVAGTQQSIQQAIGSARRGGYVSYGGVPHEVELDADDLFIRHTHLHGGPAPVRRYLPELIDLVRSRKIRPVRSSM